MTCPSDIKGLVEALEDTKDACRLVAGELWNLKSKKVQAQADYLYQTALTAEEALASISSREEGADRPRESGFGWKLSAEAQAKLDSLEQAQAAGAAYALAHPERFIVGSPAPATRAERQERDVDIDAEDTRAMSVETLQEAVAAADAQAEREAVEQLIARHLQYIANPSAVAKPLADAILSLLESRRTPLLPHPLIALLTRWDNGESVGDLITQYLRGEGDWGPVRVLVESFGSVASGLPPLVASRVPEPGPATPSEDR